MQFVILSAATLGFFALAAIGGLWWSYVSTVLWGWFVVPLGLPAIGLWHMYGLRMFYSLFMGFQRNPKEQESVSSAIAGVILGPMFVLLFAYIAKQFM